MLGPVPDAAPGPNDRQVRQFDYGHHSSHKSATGGLAARRSKRDAARSVADHFDADHQRDSDDGVDGGLRAAVDFQPSIRPDGDAASDEGCGMASAFAAASACRFHS